MYLHQAIPKLSQCVGIKFKDLFPELPDDLRTNKGRVGQLLQIKIGLPLDSALHDFEDGELKTNKSDSKGNPKETMFIHQISREIDTLVCEKPKPFESSNLFQKIRRIVFLPVCKDSENHEDWFFVSLIDVNLDENNYLFSKLKDDYFKICGELKKQATFACFCWTEKSKGRACKDGCIHTTNGELIQVRSKDAKKNGSYNPIFSETYGRHISDKNHAFYFRKNFMSFARQHGDVIKTI